MRNRNNIFGGLMAGVVLGVVALVLAFGRDADAVAAKSAIAILALLTAALFCAAMFAVFFRPTSAKGRKLRLEVVSGFRLAGGILVGIAVFCALLASSLVAFGIVESHRLPRLAATAIASASVLFMFITVQRWARPLIGWIAWSILNGLIMLSSGHVLNNPEISVPRWIPLSWVILAFLSVQVSLRFTTEYSLTPVDKAAVMTWAISYVASVCISASKWAHSDLASMATVCVGTSALIFAWWIHRSDRRRKHHATRSHEVQVTE